MPTRISRPVKLFSKCFRFQPIEPDTLVYSNEEEDDDVSNNDSEKVLHIPQEQSPGGKSGIKLEKQKGHNRREKRGSFGNQGWTAQNHL